MKTISSLLVYVILCYALVACKKGQSETTSQQTDSIPTLATATTSVDSDKLQKYSQFLAQLDTTSMASITKAGAEYRELFATTNTETNDSAYALFRDFHQLLVMPQQTIMDKDNEKYGQLLYNQGKPTQKVKEHYEEMQKNGFYLGTVEGYVYLSPLPEYQKQYVFDKLSPAMQVYFSQKQKEEMEGTADDGGLLVEPKVLAERIIFWEDFLTKNPTFRWKNSLEADNRSTTYFLINGLDNTPTFSYETKSLDTSFRTAYRFLIDTHGQTKIGKLITEYYAILSKTNLKDSPKAQEFRAKVAM